MRLVLLLGVVSVGAVALAPSPRSRPVHLWIRPGEFPLRTYASPGGALVEGWVADETSWLNRVDDGSCDVSRGPSRWGDAFRVWCTEEEPGITPWLRDIGLPIDGPRAVYFERASVPSREDAEGWIEYVARPDELPVEAVPDATLAGTWEWRGSGPAFSRYDLGADGDFTLEQSRGSFSGAGRWGRIDDVFFAACTFTSGGSPQCQPDDSTHLFVMIVDPTGKSMRSPHLACGYRRIR